MEKGIRLWLAVLISVSFLTGMLGGICNAKERVLRISQEGEPPTLYPTSKIGDNPLVHNIANLVTEKLLDWNWIDAKPVPVLAESFRHVDPVTFEIKLRKENIKFTNGEPFDVNAVKYSLELLWKESYFRGYTKEWEGIEIVDNQTVRIRSKIPHPISWSGLMRAMFMYPPKYHQSKGQEYMFHPVGTGPYVFDRWDRGDRITVTANREYWGQKPGFDKIIFRWISEPSTKIAALETGEVDLVSSFPTTYADRVKVNKNLVLRQIPGLRGHGLAFDGRKPPFSDKRVRQALNYAVDKDSIIQHLYGGYASRLGGQLLTPAYAGWNPGLKDYPYDLEKAKKLLKEAGYPNGFEVKLDFPVGRFPQVEEVCQSVAGQLARAGVKAKLNALEFGTYLKAITSGNHSELYYLGFDGEPEGWEHVHYFSKRGNILPPIYLNEEFAELLDKVATNPDFEQRKLLMRKALEIAQEDPFLLYLVAPENLSAHSKKLKNWKPNPAQTIYLAGVELED